MSRITMDVPVIIKQVKIDGKMNYQIRPMFFSYPVVTNRRYEKAESAFKNEMKYYFSHYIMSRSTIQNFLWFRFQPEIKFQLKEFSFSLGKQYIKGLFSYAHFDLHEHKYIFLPDFNNFMFIAESNEKGKYDVKAEVMRVMEKLLRQYRKNLGGSIEVENYTAAKGAFQSTINCTVKIQEQKFSFDQGDMMSFFAAFGGQTDFQGGTEIYKVGYDLNEKYPTELLSAWYREDLVNQLSFSIFSEENTPFVLVGSEGVGKKSVIHEALYRYVKEQEEDLNENADRLQKIWHVDPTRIIAGMSIVGMWQKRFEAILKFIMTRRKDIRALKKRRDNAKDKILFDNPVALLRIGKSASNDMTLSDVLKTYLEKRMLQVIVLATPEEWKIVQEKDRRFADLFRVIRVEEPDTSTAVKMILQRRKLLEVEYGNQISAHAIHRLFTIHRNYFKRKALPGGVMKLLNQLAIKYKYAKVDVTQVEREFEDFSGLSEEMVDDNNAFEQNSVRDTIALKLVGQANAVDALADTIHVIKSKLSNPNKPKGSFLFIGPTGVGKTQAAKVLAEYLLGGERKLMRFDMNEFIDSYSVSRLIGDEFNPEGQLTGKVKYNPFGIVLLDEIEKAHPKVHDLLLQVLDDGRLTDSLGRTVDFSNTIIIMTSNIGADQVSARVGFEARQSETDAVYRRAVENRFRPEFINRIDKIVIFQALQQEHILGIAQLQINELLQRDGFVRRTTILNIQEEALEWVSNRGFDEKMGGRALKRQIEKDLTALSAEQLLMADSETPVIMDIFLEDNVLTPYITTLDFEVPSEADWMPRLPDESKGGRFYRDLLRVIERLERNISEGFEDDDEDDDEVRVLVFGGDEKAEEDEDLNWQYYDFKDKLMATKEKIREMILGFRSNYFKGGPAIPLRLKGGGLNSYMANSPSGNSSRGYRRLLQDKLFQKEALSEINEFYRLSSDQFDSMNTEFISSYIDVAFLSLQAIGFVEEETDIVEIHVSSCIEGQGTKEVEHLLNIYVRYFEHYEIQYDYNKVTQKITAESHSLLELLKGEEGLHLYYRPHQTPLPIRLEIKHKDYKTSRKGMRVTRLYDSKGTLTDLKSGFSNDYQIRPEEFHLILFAGLNEDLRERLMR